MEPQKVQRLWNPVSLGPEWVNCDTSIIDDIAPSWFERREVLQNGSQEYIDFIDELKRAHAIETGVVERLYDLSSGMTETFIRNGFIESYISHTDTNIPVPQLLNHLTDHLNAVDFIFDVVKSNRPFTIGFIHELHSLVTRSQNFAEGRDQFGTKTSVELRRGQFKVRENNPTREDGTVVQYCPPLQVTSEMDNLMMQYEMAVKEQCHPVILASWFHHAFTTIHPYQDGNGRVARLLASLILIKYNYFPFTVHREDAKVRYIQALEAADSGQPQPLVTYFSEVQRRHIERALNLREVSSSSLDEVTRILASKLEDWQRKQQPHKELLRHARDTVFSYCRSFMDEAQGELKKQLGDNVTTSIDVSSPDGTDDRQHYYYGQIIGYAKRHDYYFNRNYPKGWIMLKIGIDGYKQYHLGITIHHYGYDDNTIAIGAFVEYFSGDDAIDDRVDRTLPLDIKPHIVSISEAVEPSEKNIRTFLNNALTIALAHIASDF